MSKKVRTTLYLNKKVIEKAKKLGLNLSVVCENSLIQAIEAMEGVYGKREPKIHPISFLRKEVVDWEGFEPPTSAMPRQHSTELNYQPTSPTFKQRT